MKKFLNKISGYKTYAFSAVMFLYALVILGWQQGQWDAALKVMIEAAGLGSLRNAIK